MNSMNNALAQLALLLRGSGMGGGPGNDWSTGSSNPWAPPVRPMGMAFQNRGVMPGAHPSTSGARFRATPVQEFILPGTNPAWEVPYGYGSEWMLPKPEILPIPDTGPLPPDLIPPIPLFPPYNPPYPIPDSQGDGTTGAPPNVDTYPPFNPPLEIPDERIDDGISELGPGEPVRDIPDDEECEKEWEDAQRRCNKEAMRLRKMRSGEHRYFNQSRCEEGYVSERCGGTPIKQAPPKKPKKWKLTA